MILYSNNTWQQWYLTAMILGSNVTSDSPGSNACLQIVLIGMQIRMIDTGTGILILILSFDNDYKNTVSTFNTHLFSRTYPAPDKRDKQTIVNSKRKKCS